mmetsp:Transcript_18381/g.29930  ORF Transcript_18381/g.29930 Transcript_18381/m.29930 type:complete len:1041 (+) Transcript_18381:313-3435(+)
MHLSYFGLEATTTRHLQHNYGINERTTAMHHRHQQHGDNNDNDTPSNASRTGGGRYEHEVEESPFWDFLAPRPKSAPAKQQQVGGGAVPAQVVISNDQLVQCQHCHKMTPVNPIGSAPTTSSFRANEMHHPTTPATNTTHPKTPHSTPALLNNNTPPTPLTNDDDQSIRSEQSYLHQQVLRAAQETALTSSGPTFLWENKHNLFALCGAAPKPPKKGRDGKPLPTKVGADGKPAMSKNIKKLSKLLTNKPALVEARSANMMSSLGLPDGFTVLHAACHAGNAEVVEYLLANHVLLSKQVENDKGVEQQAIMLDLSERDLQGRTALHIAADRGHIEVITLLRAAYDKLVASLCQTLLEEEDSDDSDDDEEATKGLAKTMAKLTTCDSTQSMRSNTNTTKTATPKTPKSRSPMRRKPKSSRSPKPPSRSPKRSPLRSPAFSGSNAPIDLAGRTPLGYAATSPVPKAKKHRAALENLLYQPGDRSIVGVGNVERTPPKARCGPRGKKSPRRGVGGGRRVVMFDGEDGDGTSVVAGSVVAGANSYRSPTPYKPHGRYATPGSTGSSTSTNYATPFSSPPTIHEEEVEGGEAHGKKDNALQLQWGASEMNGWRIEMEDKILVKYELYGEGENVPPRPLTFNEATVGAAASDGTAASPTVIPTMGLFGVFDGHGDGGFASDFIATNLEQRLKSHPSWPLAYHSCNTSHNPLTSVLTQTCHDLDEDLRRDVTKPRDGGTTAIMALVSDGYLFVANVGDSRCILVTKRTTVNGAAANEGSNKDSGDTTTTSNKPCYHPSTIKVIAMSDDHKPNLPAERARIGSSGLSVQTDHCPPDENDPDGEYTSIHRVKKSNTELLGVARAFGDYDYKSNEKLSPMRQAVVCTPDVVVRERAEGEDMYLVLACDGVWDVMSNEDVGAFVARRVAELLGWVGDVGVCDDDGTTSEQHVETTSANNTSSNSERAANNNSVQGEVLARVGDDLLAECLRKGSRDNMSVLIVALPASGLLAGEGGIASSLPSAAVVAMTKTEEEVPVVVVDDTVRALAYE